MDYNHQAVRVVHVYALGLSPYYIAFHRKSKLEDSRTVVEI